MQKKRLFTGLQPSGQLHIGNYFGALQQTVEMFRSSEGLVMVADYHALTTLKSPEDLRKNISDVVRDYVAVGLNPEKAILFQQSSVPAHTELAWIFDCLVTVPFLMQAHAYKDKVAKGLEANAGLFTYPMLMAADILLYDTDLVPVGADQRQHVEYAREAAAKFNSAFGQTFKEPKEKILDTVSVVPGTDGKKMSKSYGNTIPLFGTKEEITKAVMGIVTDSGVEIEGILGAEHGVENVPIQPGQVVEIPRPANVYRIHVLFKNDKKELLAFYRNNQQNYKAIKDALIEDIEAFIAPMREKRNGITDADVKAILKDGAERANALAEATMKKVRAQVGVAI